MAKFCLLVLISFVLILLASSIESGSTTDAGVLTNAVEESTSVPSWPPATRNGATVQDLHREYNTIFQYGNRNAASHRWSTFLLQRSNQMTTDRLRLFFSGFCAVSGSPVRPSDYNRYRLKLPRVGGGSVSGSMHYCCWPCVCDTQDFIRIDTKNVTTRNDNNELQTAQHFFAVIGNPCDHPEKLTEPFYQPFYGGRTTTLAETAQEVRCLEDGTLEGATLTDNGYVIMSIFFDAQTVADDEDQDEEQQGKIDPAAITSSESSLPPPPQPGRITTLVQPDGSTLLFQDEREFGPRCDDRANHGYNSGMGEIFRKVCAISPISPEALRALPSAQQELEATSEPSCDIYATALKDSNSVNGAAAASTAQS